MFDELFDDLSPREGRHVAAYVASGAIEGYAVYDRPGPRHTAKERVLRVVEITAVSSVARGLLWSYLFSIGAEVVEFDELALDDADLAAAFGHDGSVRTVTDRTWNRLIDVPSALTMRSYCSRGELVIGVHDGVCAWNEGHYELGVGDDGLAEVSRTDRAADLEFDVGALASVVSGATMPSQLARDRGVRELSSGALRRADGLFSSDVVPFCTALC